MGSLFFTPELYHILRRNFLPSCLFVLLTPKRTNTGIIESHFEQRTRVICSIIRIVITKIPKNLQAVLWSEDIKTLDVQKDKTYIINQVLRYGSLDEIKWLFKIYPKREVKIVFTQHPLPIFTPQSFNFVSKFLLGFNQPPNEDKYLRSY